MTSRIEKGSSLNIEWLRENLGYDPLTGIFSWKKPGFGRTVGKPIGKKGREGKNYLMMRVDGELFYAHRLAWFYVHGEWPTNIVDHIDGNKTNNAISNLREATYAQNAARRPTTRLHGPSRGVVPHQGGFVARIHHGGKRHYLGYFKDAEEARAAYEAKAREIHGEFAHPTEAKKDRGDWLHATSCEICGSHNNLRYHRTILGTPRGMLCINCVIFVSSIASDPVDVRKYAAKAIDYLQSLDVPEDEIPDDRAASARRFRN